MIAFIARRLLQALGVLVVVSFIGFLLFALSGDPVASILGLDATPADRDELRSRLGLDDPFLLRYIRYALNAAQGQFGISYATARPVEEVIIERLPATIELAFVAVLFSLAIGIPLGDLYGTPSRKLVGAFGHDRIAFGGLVADIRRRHSTHLPVCGGARLAPILRPR